jgi:hypothetical protein
MISKKSIADILVDFWDPLDIQGNEKLRDEYDAYASIIETMLHGGADARELEEYLYNVRVIQIGIERLESREREAANRLAALRT